MPAIGQPEHWDAIYQTASRYYTWAQNQGSHAYSKLPPIQTLSQNAWKTSQTFLWKHKAWVIGGVMIAVAGWIVRYIRSKIPQYPVVKMESTQSVAELQIEIPKELPVPLNVSLTFCIDTSGSMQGKSIEAVKRALSTVLSNAQDIVDRSDKAKMRMAIVGFDDQSRIISPITKVIKSGSAQPLLKQVQDLECGGCTDILEGLAKATEQLQKMAKTDKQTSHTVILLTDGGSKINKDRLSSIHNTLASASANLFGIGIEQGHDEQILRQIVGNKESGFRGEYIDTRKNDPTIEEAIATIYKQATSSFQGLSLSTEQLPAGTWSIGRTRSIEKEGRSVCNLESLSEGATRTEYITIYGEKLPDRLDLSTVRFQLAFTDPKGRQGTLSLPWNPNTTINPQILQNRRKALQAQNQTGQNPRT